jgi:polar amino acid transport system substrate-binding protein
MIGSLKSGVSMKSFRTLARLTVCLALLAGCANTAPAGPAARAELAPAGKLRVGLIMSNQVLVAKDARTGQISGVSVDLGKALAQRLGVPFEAVQYANPLALAKSFGQDEWDIAFLAYDPARAQEVVFSPAYMEVDNSYLVLANSKVASVDKADAAGVTIAVPEKSAPDLYLTRTLKAAKVLRLPGGIEAGIKALDAGQADAYAENAHMLSLYAAKVPGGRVLEGRYTIIRHAIATRKGKTEAAAFVKQFVSGAKADGTVAEAIRRAELQRARVASDEAGAL